MDARPIIMEAAIKEVRIDFMLGSLWGISGVFIQIVFYVARGDGLDRKFDLGIENPDACKSAWWTDSRALKTLERREGRRWIPAGVSRRNDAGHGDGHGARRLAEDLFAPCDVECRDD